MRSAVAEKSRATINESKKLLSSAPSDGLLISRGPPSSIAHCSVSLAKTVSDKGQKSDVLARVILHRLHEQRPQGRVLVVTQPLREPLEVLEIFALHAQQGRRSRSARGAWRGFAAERLHEAFERGIRGSGDDSLRLFGRGRRGAAQPRARPMTARPEHDRPPQRGF